MRVGSPAAAVDEELEEEEEEEDPEGEENDGWGGRVRGEGRRPTLEGGESGEGRSYSSVSSGELQISTPSSGSMEWFSGWC